MHDVISAVSRNDDVLNEYSLVRDDGDDARTRELLGDEVARVIALSGEERGEEGGRGGGEEGRSDEVRGGRAGGGERTVRRADPGMSVLQDSVLGMTADGENYMYTVHIHVHVCRQMQ